MLSDAGRVVQASIVRAFSDETRRCCPRSNSRPRMTLAGIEVGLEEFDRGGVGAKFR
jgi:hypothetical protein